MDKKEGGLVTEMKDKDGDIKTGADQDKLIASHYEELHLNDYDKIWQEVVPIGVTQKDIERFLLRFNK